ncbi:MAG: M28 family peptidase [Gemmatimonadota bacterium]
MIRFAPWVTLLLMAAPLAAPAAAQELLQDVKLPHADEAASRITENFILGHTRYLSSDLLEGRGPGTRGDSLAQAYVAAQFETLGLEPAGPDGSWLQTVPLVSMTSTAPDVLTIGGPGGETLDLRRVDEWIAYTGKQEPRTSLADAEIVFVGYGIVAPEEDWDDYKGTDLSGKVLLFLNNDPTGDRFAGNTRLYYGRWTYKYEIAAEKGAAAAFIIHTTPSAGYAWQVVQSSFGGTEFELPAPPDEKRLEVRGWLTEDAAGRVVALGGHDLGELVAAAQRPDFEPVALGVTVDLEITTAIEESATANVIGRLPGGDRAGEAVLYTAHFDHLGIGQPVEGDSIYNGAVDNALGTSTMLAIARAFAHLPERPSRSILFAAVGAEEQGLLGSEFLGRHPPLPACDLFANINLDTGNFWGRTLDVPQIGGGKSDLDQWLDRFAREQGRVVEPEPFPDRGYFYRSDQFNLAKVGVPALYLEGGIKTVEGGPERGREISEQWLAERYHQPSDEILESWDLSGQVEDARLLFRVGYAVAQAATAPAWNPGDEFAAARAACSTP